MDINIKDITDTKLTVIKTTDIKTNDILGDKKIIENSYCHTSTRYLYL